MTDLPANYIFLPWVRQGAAAGIQTPDMTVPNQAAIVSVKIKLRVNDTPPDVERQVRLYGPGDVIGIDPQQVVRTEPRHLSTDFEPNYFPAIEFDRPDFPWLFTPAAANSANRLRSWLCLVVVRKQDGVTLRVDRNLPLAVLEIRGPAKPSHELPDLSESWAWAHAQVAGTQRDTDSLRSSLGGNPALTVSRLLCPRRLDPLTDYLACVVPTFELGRRAGLGQQILPADEQPPLGLAPAWVIRLEPPESPAEAILPVYFHWEFRTGIGGDFESLVGLLKAREVPSNVGKRPIDLTNPGFTIDPPPTPGAKGTTLGLEGALRVVGSQPDEWPDAVRGPFQKALQKILNVSWDVATNESDKHDPIVGPPIYGCWQAARHTVNITAAPGVPLNWLDELSLDPRQRVAAALGTKVVQTEQEDLMASAWEQLGEIERVNQMKRQAQFGRAVNAVYHVKHLSQFSEETLLKVLAPAQSRIVVDPVRAGDTRALLSRKISQSAVPQRAVSTSLRRLTSSRGVLSTRFTTAGTPPLAVVARLGTMMSFTLFTKQPAGVATLNQVSQSQTTPAASILKQTVTYERILPTLDSAPRIRNFTIVPEGAKRTLLNFEPGPADSPDADMFRKVAKANQEHFAKLFTTAKIAPAPLFNLLDVNIKTKLLQSVDPEKTITARVQASLSTNGNQPKGDPLEQIMDAPSFPQPVYEALRDLSQDFLLPGLENVPANTVTLLTTNPKFVESFMVGLNAEMSSELLWRNYPTDQRGTYFRQFWDATPDPNQEDIQPIINWKNRQLGENSPNTSGKLVLLIRGNLLRRYPNSVIYAVKAVKFKNTLDLSREAKDERHPLFRGTLKPDVTFLGFNLSDTEALGKPPNDPNGWFFVIQQQPTEPCFGLDVADFAKPLTDPPTSWNDLSWRHFAKTEEELKALSHVSTSKVFPEIDQVKWGKNSAHQAFITLQRPVRIAIHAKQMIKT